jgi:hypothetical protein
VLPKQAGRFGCRGRRFFREPRAYGPPDKGLFVENSTVDGAAPPRLKVEKVSSVSVGDSRVCPVQKGCCPWPVFEHRPGGCPVIAPGCGERC